MLFYLFSSFVTMFTELCKGNFVSIEVFQENKLCVKSVLNWAGSNISGKLRLLNLEIKFHAICWLYYRVSCTTPSFFPFLPPFLPSFIPCFYPSFAPSFLPSSLLTCCFHLCYPMLFLLKLPVPTSLMTIVCHLSPLFPN